MYRPQPPWLLVAVLFALASQTAALPWPEQVSLELQTEDGQEHPDALFHGFILKEVFTHSYRHDAAQSKGTHVLRRRITQFSANPHMRRANHHRRLGFADLDASATLTRDKVLSLAKLNLLAYPGADPTPPTGVTYAPEMVTRFAAMYSASDGIWHPSNATQDLAGMQALRDMVQQELNASETNNATNTSYTYVSETKALANFGVVALIFERGGSRVVVFRGSYTPGDFANIEPWSLDWSLERYTGRMKTLWEDHAKLPWDSTRTSRAAEGDWKYRTAVRAGGMFTRSTSDLPTDLATAVDGTRVKLYGAEVGAAIKLTEADAKSYGYYPITQAVMEAVRSTLGGKSLLISGHSQGGSRAQLAGMYLQKKYPTETKWPVVTFAATGTGCFSRASRMNYPDVDPTVAHPHMTDYTHPLDPWNALGLDVGRTCYFGTTNITSTNQYKYCEKIWGYTGPTLIYVDASITDGIKTAKETDLGYSFKNCR